MQSAKRKMVLCALVACTVLFAACAPQAAPVVPLGTGEAAPAFSLTQARGGTVVFEPNTGPALVSFIRAGAGDDEAATSSRSQIVFAKSMQQQYASDGLRVLLVESAVDGQSKRPTANELLNFSYDWDLAMPLLADTHNAATARAYSVERMPTTFLVDADGRIAQRWNGFASAGQLGLAIQELLGGATNTAACQQTPLETPFAGFGSARKLSPHLWLVDNGQEWTHTVPQPTTWLMFGGVQPPTLVLTVDGMDKPLFSVMPERMPDAEARPLLALAPPEATQAYQFTTNVLLPQPGCVTLQAELNDHSHTFNGIARIAVR